MARNYECAMCGTGSDGNISFCTICGDNGTIIYTGKHDREVEQARLVSVSAELDPQLFAAE